jgi:hypothetical protein
MGEVNPNVEVVYRWSLGGGVEVRVGFYERLIGDSQGDWVKEADPEQRIDFRLFKETARGTKALKSGFQLPASHLVHLRRAIEALDRHIAGLESE